MPPSDDEFDQLAAEVGVDADDADEFDSLAEHVGVSVADEPTGTAAPSRGLGTGSAALDASLGLADGVTLGHGAEFGAIGDDIGSLFADLLNPGLRGRELSGQRGVSGELYDRAQETTLGKGGKMAGQVGMGTLAAMGTGGGALDMMGTGAATGAIAAGGESGYDEASDAYDIAGGAAVGGALAGLGGLAGKGLEKLSGAMNAPVREGVSQAWAPIASRGEEALAALAKSAPTIDKYFTEPVKSLGNKLGQKVIPWAMDAARSAAIPRALGAQAAVPAAGAGGKVVGGAIAPSSASAQVAYGSEPTMSWAVQSVLSSGDSRLPPAAEQRLTEAVMSGDVDRVISANFALQQKYPAYAKRMQDEIESLQESGE